MSHDILPFGSPLYNTILDIRYNIGWIWKREAILNAKYVSDCSMNRWYDELNNFNELWKRNTLAGSIEE